MAGNSEKNRGSSLAGWAAIISAIATLIAAFGIPQIIPELVKRSSQSNEVLKKEELSTPSNKSVKTEEDIEVSSTVSGSVGSPIEAVQSLRQSMDYLKAREILFSAGWQPIDKELSDSNRETSSSEESISLRWFGIDLDEIEGCQPTGLGLCIGNLELVDGRSIRLVIGQGKNSPRLVSWTNSFYIEPSQKTLDSINQLKPGIPYYKVRKNLIAEGWRAPIVNPMYTREDSPKVERDFQIQHPTFDDCYVESGEVKTCNFTLSSDDDRKLTITTNVKKLEPKNYEINSNRRRPQYELTVKSWILK